MELGSLQPIPKVQLDKYDRRILSHLMLDGRTTFSAIAKKIGISKHRVINRVKKLEEKGVITGYQAYLNHLKLGLGMNFIYIKTKGTQTLVENYLQALSRIPFVASSKEILGEYNVLVTMFYASKVQRDKTIDSILKTDLIRDFRILDVENIRFTSFDFGKESVKDKKIMPTSLQFSKSLKLSKFDKKDIEILYSISQNYRKPLHEIASSIKLTREAVNFRLKKLVKNALVGKFQPVVNFYSLGYEGYVLRLKLAHRQEKHGLLDYLSHTFACNAIYELNSDWDIIAFLHFPSVAELRKFEDILMKIYSSTIFDYSFDLIKHQTKLDWFPQELAEGLKRNFSLTGRPQSL